MGIFSREGAQRAALLSSTASLCAVESQAGFIPLRGVSRTRFPSAVQQGRASTAPWADTHKHGGAMQPGRTAEAAAGSCERSLGILQHPCGHPRLQQGCVLGLSAHHLLLAAGATRPGHGSFQRCRDGGLQPEMRSSLPRGAAGSPAPTPDGGMRLQTRAARRGDFLNGFCLPVPACQRGENHF